MGPTNVWVVREFLSVIIVRILSDKLYRTYVQKGPRCIFMCINSNAKKATDLNNRKVALWSSESDTFSPFQKIMRK